MISLTLHGHPDKGADTRFTLNHGPQTWEDLSVATWEREVILHAMGFTITESHREVSTIEMLNECFDYENANTSFILRALGWSESDLQGMWNAHGERAEAERARLAVAHADRFCPQCREASSALGGYYNPTDQPVTADGCTVGPGLCPVCGYDRHAHEGATR